MGNPLIHFSDRLSAWMEFAAGAALVGVMLLIGSDIVGRLAGHPVPGTFEIVSLAGGLIIGLALPATSRSKGHVGADILLAKLPAKSALLLKAATRLIGIALFLIAAYGMVMMGARLKEAGEVTAELSIPFYCIPYAIGGAFLVQALILLSEILIGDAGYE
ncbi:MAG: TRAP transporter small permease [Acidobacteria bacterium]|nr:TRAP transporter small permease [Acidobacteriota bacterium]